MDRKLYSSYITAGQGSRVEKKRTAFPVLLVFLVLIAFPSSIQTPFFGKDSHWEPIQGPTIYGGTVSILLIDPLDSSHLFAFQQQKDLSYVLFESLDAAANWNAIYTFQDFISQATIDPSNPSILYASTSIAILQSEDKGRNWIKFADFGPAIVSPAANTIFSIENMKYTDDCPTGYINFVASRDKGNTWKKYPLGCYTVPQISTTPSYPDRIYIRAVRDMHSFLHRSNDGGDTWTTIPLTGPWFTQGFYPIAVDPSQPEKLYTSSASGIIISTNGGLTWQSVLDTPIMGPFRFSFSNGVIYAGVDSVVSGELPIIYRSLDGGETWETLPWTVPDRLNDLQTMNCSPGWIIAALNGFGVYRSVDGGQSWQAANNGMRSTVIVNKMAISQSEPDTVYAIAHWPHDAFFKTSDGGQTWSEPLLETSLFTAVAHPNNPNILWVADRLGIQESLNGGESWRRVSTLPVYDIAVSPDSPERPCAVGNSADESYLLCRTATSQKQKYYWVKSQIPNVRYAGKLAISPKQGNLMMLTGMAGDALEDSVFASQNGGFSWQEIFRGPQDYYPLTLTVSGDQPVKVIAVFFQYHPDNLLIYQSLDAGKSWQNITNHLAKAGGEMWTGWTYKAPVVFDDAGAIYFGTKNIVLQQMGNGQPWKVIWNKEDLIQDMLILPGSQDYLLVASKKNLWKLQLPFFRSIWMPIIFQ